MKILTRGFSRLAVIFSLSLAINSVQAVEIPFMETFEGGAMTMHFENYPYSPATLLINTCSTGRTGKCLYLSNLIGKTGDYRPAVDKRDIDMRNGQVYTVSMLIKSDSANRFKSYVKDQTQAWLPISDTAYCYATTEWSQCSYSFTANIPSNVTGPFAMYLELAEITGSLWIDDVSITSGSTTTQPNQCPADATSIAACGLYTQQDVTNAANAAAAETKQMCKDDPASCGIVIPACPITSGTSATLAANLDIHIPNATYQPIFGNPMNLWVDLQFSPTTDGSLMWKFKDYGINP